MKILIIEDSVLLVRSLKNSLSDNFIVQAASTGQKGIERAEHENYDLIILDLKLPDMSGQAICKAIRKAGVNAPILILTANHVVTTKVELLQLGADDYLTKPFHLEELQARIKALLRRSPYELKPDVLRVGSLSLDPSKRYVERDGTEIQLRRKEFDVLEYLVRSKGRTVTRSMIFNNVWEADKDNWGNTVDVHIKYLRDKIDRPFGSPLIKTAYGIGYKIDDVPKNLTH